MPQFFRRDALKKLSSPEQLNKMLVIIPLKGWIAVAAGFALTVVFILWGIFGSIPVNYNLEGYFIAYGSAQNVYSEYVGSVTEVYVSGNSDPEIKVGDTICTIRSYDGEIHTLTSMVYGLIDSCYVSKGKYVTLGDPVLSVRTLDSEPYVGMAVPIDQAHRLYVGQPVYISPNDADTETYGYLIGSITDISDSIMSTEDNYASLYGPEMVQKISTQSCLFVKCALNVAEDTLPNGSHNGYQWTKEAGSTVVLEDLETVTVKVEEESSSPFSFIFSSLMD